MGTEVTHVTRDSDTTFKVKRSRSPGRFTHRGLNAWGRFSGDRENVLGVGNYCYVASARRRARRWGVHGEMRGAGAYCVATRTACLLYSSAHSYLIRFFMGCTCYLLYGLESMSLIRLDDKSLDFTFNRFMMKLNCLEPLI